MRFVTAGQVCDIVRIPYQTLHHWVLDGHIRPIHDPGGSGRQRLFLLRDIVAISAGRGLRGKGFPLRVAADAMRFLGSFSEEQFEACFSEGRKYLLLAAGEVAERLMTQKEISHSRVLAKINEASGIPPVALDVERLYRLTIDAAENPAEAEPVEVTA
jgi:DNA-binding transcriptional MerR regulator